MDNEASQRIPLGAYVTARVVQGKYSGEQRYGVLMKYNSDGTVTVRGKKDYVDGDIDYICSVAHMGLIPDNDVFGKTMDFIRQARAAIN